MEGIYGSEEIGVAERAAKFRNIHNVRLRLPHQLQSMYRARKNGLQNIVKKDPDRAKQSRNSRKEFHQTTYKPFFRALYFVNIV